MSYPLWESLSQLKKYKWVDLTHTFDSESPHFSSFENAETKTLYQVKDDGFFAQSWQFATQYGTHIDAPIHFVEHKRYLHELGLQETVLPLIVLDFSKEVAQDADFRLTKEHILEWEAKNGQIEQDTFVAFRSDWSKRWPDKEQFENRDADASIDIRKHNDTVGERYVLGLDTFQIELLTGLDELPTRGSVILAISPKPKNAPGFPVRAFAISPS